MKENKDYIYNKDNTRRGWVESDDYPDDPRDWDNLGHMVCLNRKYKLGDPHLFKPMPGEEWESWDDLEQAIKSIGGVLIFPLGIYDHGGISMYIGKKVDRWDSGQVGFIYVTQEDLDREGITDLKRAEAILRNEVRVYDCYLRGDVYAYSIQEKQKTCSCGECEEWVFLNSCAGYYDVDEAQQALKEEIDA